MSLLHDMLGKPTSGEVDLRRELAAARAHAEELEEMLLIHDPREAIDPKVHSRVCWERQRAAHAWRRANTLQSQLNGAENRRYSRGMMCWMLAGFAFTYLQMNGVKLENVHLTEVMKFLAAVI